MAGTISFALINESDLDVHMPSSTLEGFCDYLESCVASSQALKMDAQFIDALSWPLKSKDAYLGLGRIQIATLKELARLFRELVAEDHPFWEQQRSGYSNSTIRSWEKEGINVEEWIEHLKNENRIKARQLADMAEKRIVFLESKQTPG